MCNFSTLTRVYLLTEGALILSPCVRFINWTIRNLYVMMGFLTFSSLILLILLFSYSLYLLLLCSVQSVRYNTRGLHKVQPLYAFCIAIPQKRKLRLRRQVAYSGSHRSWFGKAQVWIQISPSKCFLQCADQASWSQN